MNKANNMNNEIILEVKNLSKNYFQDVRKFEVLHNVNLVINKGEMVALVGPSGSGKTSLLNLLGLLDVASRGEIFFKNQKVSNLSDRQREKIRGRDIGFVFQFHHLLPDFSAVENVVMPQLIQGIKKTEALSRAKELLVTLGMGHRLNSFPSRLSGGEQQRVAIARAIALRPSFVIADEPTGNLDMQTAREVFSVLLELVNEYGISIIIATHSEEIFNKIPRKIFLKDKQLTENT